jgi:hypothetical protein
MVEALTGGQLAAIRLPGSRKAWMMGFGLLAMLSTAVFVAPVQGPVSVMLRHAAVLGMRKPTTILAFASPSSLRKCRTGLPI